MAEQVASFDELDAQHLKAAIFDAQRSVALFSAELRQQLEFGFCRAEEEGRMIASHGA